MSKKPKAMIEICRMSLHVSQIESERWVYHQVMGDTKRAILGHYAATASISEMAILAWQTPEIAENGTIFVHRQKNHMIWWISIFMADRFIIRSVKRLIIISQKRFVVCLLAACWWCCPISFIVKTLTLPDIRKILHQQTVICLSLRTGHGKVVVLAVGSRATLTILDN